MDVRSLTHVCCVWMCARYMHGNKLDLRVTPTMFKGIQSLDEFTSDVPDKSITCDDGAWETAHGVKFCVLSSGSSAAGTSSLL